jgi:hypothetical protein
VKTGWFNFQEWKNLAESSKEGSGSKRAVLPMMMMMTGRAAFSSSALRPGISRPPRSLFPH